MRGRVLTDLEMEERSDLLLIGKNTQPSRLSSSAAYYIKTPFILSAYGIEDMFLQRIAEIYFPCLLSYSFPKIIPNLQRWQRLQKCSYRGLQRFIFPVLQVRTLSNATQHYWSLVNHHPILLEPCQ
ncbi:unnamed protein product [Citrullus colocynthis]|uniref:Maturase K n=1 Tax=Citrullus colocynthis TaxID=252529 RepID=A0ABP0YK86_9ROSI